MREILFRGKRVDNGEWVFGDLLHNCDCVKIRENETKINHVARSFPVLPKTIGQYTGLTDKNGLTKIFEGDVVKLFDIAIGEIVCECGAFGISCRQIDYDYLASEIASVTGCDNTPMFCRNDNFVSLWELYSNYNEENSEISVIEVIGNIYDNPELLKGD